MATLAERAQIARETLFQRYDEINALWLEAEAELTKFHVPHGVDYPYTRCFDPADPQPKYDSYLNLGLEKINGKWRICHGSSDDCHPYVLDWTPITECGAWVRVSAAKHLPKLRELVVKATEDFIPKVEKGIQELKEAISQCRNDDLNELLAERAKLNGKAK